MADRYKISTNLVAEGVAVPENVQKKAPPASAGPTERKFVIPLDFSMNIDRFHEFSMEMHYFS